MLLPCFFGNLKDGRLLNSVGVNDGPRFHNYGVPPPPAPIS